MDLARQLNDVLFARLLFVLAIVTAVLWTQVDQNGATGVAFAVALGLAAVTTIPFFVFARHAEARSVAAGWWSSTSPSSPPASCSAAAH